MATGKSAGRIVNLGGSYPLKRRGLGEPTELQNAGRPQTPGNAGKKKRRRGSTRLTIDEERTVKVAAPPSGSRFKGYTRYVVQDLMIRANVVNFCRERWQTPDGEMVTAPLPAGIDGHFGPELRRFVLTQYHAGRLPCRGW